MTDFLVAGYSQELFWSLTPKQYLIHMDAAAIRIREETNLGNYQAWLAGAIAKSNKTPKPQAFMVSDPSKKPKKRPMTPGQKAKEIKAGLSWMKQSLKLPKKKRADIEKILPGQ